MTIFALFAVSAWLVTAIVLIVGLSTFAEGHDDARDLAANNRLMRLRVEVQAIAIAFVLIGLLIAEFWHF